MNLVYAESAAVTPTQSSWHSEYDRTSPEDKYIIRRAWEEDVEFGDIIQARAIWNDPW